MFYDTQRHKAECRARAQAEKLSQRISESAGDTAELAMRLGAALNTHAPQQSHTFVPPKEVLQAALEQDLTALKQHTDVAKKIQLKKDVLIPKWLPFLEQYRDSGQHSPFAPLVWMVIWLLDAEFIDKCIHWADLAIKQQQKLPEHFSSSSLDTFVAEGLHDWAQRQLKNGHSASPFFDWVIERVESGQWLVTEPIALNKLYKLVAQFAEKDEQLEIAEKYYLKCIDVNPEKHGIKTALGKIQTKLGKQLTLP